MFSIINQSAWIKKNIERRTAINDVPEEKSFRYGSKLFFFSFLIGVNISLLVSNKLPIHLKTKCDRHFVTKGIFRWKTISYSNGESTPEWHGNKLSTSKCHVKSHKTIKIISLQAISCSQSLHNHSANMGKRV